MWVFSLLYIAQHIQQDSTGLCLCVMGEFLTVFVLFLCIIWYNLWWYMVRWSWFNSYVEKSVKESISCLRQYYHCLSFISHSNVIYLLWAPLNKLHLLYFNHYLKRLLRQFCNIVIILCFICICSQKKNSYVCFLHERGQSFRLHNYFYFTCI